VGLTGGRSGDNAESVQKTATLAVLVNLGPRLGSPEELRIARELSGIGFQPVDRLEAYPTNQIRQ
jgi:hypothetical protein